MRRRRRLSVPGTTRGRLAGGGERGPVGTAGLGAAQGAGARQGLSRAGCWRPCVGGRQAGPCGAAGPWCHGWGGAGSYGHSPVLGWAASPLCLWFQAWALTGQGGQRHRAASAHTWAAGAAAPEVPPGAGPAACTPASAVTPASLLFAGSPKPSPTGRSPPPPRRRRCTWSQSMPSPGSRTSGSRSWWCCPGRLTSMSGWPATVRGGGAGRGGLSLPRGPPELVPSVCTHKLTEAEAWDGQPHRALGSLQRERLGAGHQGRGRLRDASVAAGPGWGGLRPGGRLTRTCQPGSALGSQNTLRRAVCRLSSEESAAGAVAMLVVSPSSWGWKEPGWEVFCPGHRGGHWVAVAGALCPAQHRGPCRPPQRRCCAEAVASGLVSASRHAQGLRRGSGPAFPSQPRHSFTT